MKEMMNALLLSFGLPQNLWGGAVLIATKLLNLVSYSKTNYSI